MTEPWTREQIEDLRDTLEALSELGVSPDENVASLIATVDQRDAEVERLRAESDNRLAFVRHLRACALLNVHDEIDRALERGGLVDTEGGAP